MDIAPTGSFVTQQRLWIDSLTEMFTLATATATTSLTDE